jgi:hypothetical protein
MQANILFITTNFETGMEACVVANTKAGFNVVLKDIDSGHCVPEVRIFPELSAAITYAKKTGSIICL